MLRVYVRAKKAEIYLFLLVEFCTALAAPGDGILLLLCFERLPLH